MEKKQCVDLLCLHAVLIQRLSCPYAETCALTRYLTMDRHLRRMRKWKDFVFFIFSFLTFILLVSVQRLSQRIATSYLLFSLVFHFKFLRQSVPSKVHVMKLCKIVTTWKRALPDKITSFKKTCLSLQNLQHSVAMDFLKWLGCQQVLVPQPVVSALRTVWLCMTDSRRSVHCERHRSSIDCTIKSQIHGNRECSLNKHNFLYRTNRLAALCFSSVKDPFRYCRLLKMTTLLLMLKPSPTVGIAAIPEDSRYPSSEYDYGLYSFESNDQSPIPFGVLPGYKYSFNPNLPHKVMTEGIIICLLAGTAFVGLVIWLAKTNFKESQQRRMRREASLRDRTLLVQSEDDIV